MNGDGDIQVWLDSQKNAGQVIVVPYIKAARETQLHYRMKLIQTSTDGKSDISQSGTVTVHPVTGAPLSRVVIRQNKEGECRMEISLSSGEETLGDFHFECPR
ncbi:curli-like amyloid fiber formation chaperone CsgH [Herbaspirillum sp. ST 5-3]|uniref:curli-like amyloid fiber formation chaperone CsgH n=1 Tax=Oxalobacteraceae TaxID=75682 RepID=UPI0010A355D9|nr:curli-like amyloid fiber formation chaperone CsgH [Herbaspirillum sp. ST 5-3]